MSFFFKLSEFLNGNSFKGKNCASCLGAQAAIAALGQPGTGGRPFLSPSFSCSRSELRYPLGYVSAQAKIMNLKFDRDERSSKEATANAKSEAKTARLRPLVFNSLFTLTSLLPHSCQGPFGNTGLDLLHGVKKGVLWNLLMVTDAIMRRGHAKKEFFKNEDDVRAVCDDRLGECGNEYGCRTFSGGFWGDKDDNGGLKGSEVLVLARLYPLTFVGCTTLIEDDDIRKEVLDQYALVLALVAEFETLQSYSDEEMKALDRDVQASMRGFNRLTDIVLILFKEEKHKLGHVFDNLKCHIWGGAAKYIRMFAHLKQLDTEFGERAQRELKLNNLLVGEEPDALLKRLIAMRLDRIYGTHAQPSQSSLPKRTVSIPLFPNMRASVGEGPMWDKVYLELNVGKYGPRVSEELVQEALDFLKEIDLHHFFYLRSAVETPEEEVLWQELKPGHTVLLKNGLYGQVLLPRVEGLPGSVQAHAALLSIMENAQHSLPGNGYHPEFPVPFLKRKRNAVTLLSEIRNRAHVNPYFGNIYREEDVQTQLFLVNTWGNTRFRGEAHRDLYWRCPLKGCAGRVRVPIEGFGMFSCPLCAFSYP